MACAQNRRAKAGRLGIKATGLFACLRVVRGVENTMSHLAPPRGRRPYALYETSTGAGR